jgi:hypothetical protein
MSQNIKALLQVDVCYNATQLVELLAAQIPGRSAGDRFVVSADVTSPGVMNMEMDDGCVFEMTCKKLK